MKLITPIIICMFILLAGCTEQDAGLKQIESDYSVQAKEPKETPETDPNEDINASPKEIIKSETLKPIEKTVRTQEVSYDVQYLLYDDEIVEYMADQKYTISLNRTRDYGAVFIINDKITGLIRQDEEYQLSDNVWLHVGASMKGVKYFMEISFKKTDWADFPEQLIEKDLGESIYHHSDKDEGTDFGKTEIDFTAYQAVYSNTDAVINSFDSTEQATALFNKNWKNPELVRKFFDGNYYYLGKDGLCYACWQSGNSIILIQAEKNEPFENLMFLISEYLEKYPSDITSDYMLDNCFYVNERESVTKTLGTKSYEIECFIISDVEEVVHLRIDGETHSHLEKASLTIIDDEMIFVKDIEYDIDGETDRALLCTS